MLLDSNTVIYAAIPKQKQLRQFLSQQAVSVSAVSYVEVLGYHKLTPENKQYFETFFQVTPTLPISDEVIQKASALRQQKKMSLGDALIAATALIHGLTLVTCYLICDQK
ncbi:MAG: type II toxin-antitoxin system VapC family toxin [Pseudomonadota bacterium]